jgi:hypothetical protein
MNLVALPDAELLAELHTLVASERELTARIVAHLGEVEERRLHLLAGYSSMFDFCVRRLRLSESAAYRRIVAARLARKFPVIYERLASGAVHLSALALLRDRLTNDNHLELLEVVSGKRKREVEGLLAAHYPAADVPSRIHKLPEKKAAPAPLALPIAPGSLGLVPPAPAPTPAPPRGAPPRIEPLSENRHKVQFTASTELREKLERARDLLSHANPTRDLESVVERAVDLLLADLEKKKLGKRARPRRETPNVGGPTPSRARFAKSCHISNATRRTVFARDGLRCAYVGHDGHRCEARAFLELDHVDPKGLGGNDDADNLRVCCRAHNQLLAECVYGRDVVDRLRFRRRKRPAT